MKALVVGYGSIGRRHIENLSALRNIEIIVCTKRKSDKFLKEKTPLNDSVLKVASDNDMTPEQIKRLVQRRWRRGINRGDECHALVGHRR